MTGTIFHINSADIDILKLRESFGPSNEFIRSLGQNYKPSVSKDGNSLSTIQLQETQLLASCSYENQTKWGKEASRINEIFYLLTLAHHFSFLNYCMIAILISLLYLIAGRVLVSISCWRLLNRIHHALSRMDFCLL